MQGLQKAGYLYTLSLATLIFQFSIRNHTNVYNTLFWTKNWKSINLPESIAITRCKPNDMTGIRTWIYESKARYIFLTSQSFAGALHTGQLSLWLNALTIHLVPMFTGSSILLTFRNEEEKVCTHSVQKTWPQAMELKISLGAQQIGHVYFGMLVPR